MARIVITTNTKEVILDITSWGDDSVDIRAKVLPAVKIALEEAYMQDKVDKSE